MSLVFLRVRVFSAFGKRRRKNPRPAAIALRYQPTMFLAKQIKTPEDIVPHLLFI
jgi:hypothetical protein